MADSIWFGIVAVSLRQAQLTGISETVTVPTSALIQIMVPDIFLFSAELFKWLTVDQMLSVRFVRVRLSK